MSHGINELEVRTQPVSSSDRLFHPVPELKTQSVPTCDQMSQLVPEIKTHSVLSGVPPSQSVQEIKIHSFSPDERLSQPMSNNQSCIARLPYACAIYQSYPNPTASNQSSSWMQPNSAGQNSASDMQSNLTGINQSSSLCRLQTAATNSFSEVQPNPDAVTQSSCVQSHLVASRQISSMAHPDYANINQTPLGILSFNASQYNGMPCYAGASNQPVTAGVAQFGYMGTTSRSESAGVMQAASTLLKPFHSSLTTMQTYAPSFGGQSCQANLRPLPNYSEQCHNTGQLSTPSQPLATFSTRVSSPMSTTCDRLADSSVVPQSTVTQFTGPLAQSTVTLTQITGTLTQVASVSPAAAVIQSTTPSPPVTTVVSIPPLAPPTSNICPQCCNGQVSSLKVICYFLRTLIVVIFRLNNRFNYLLSLLVVITCCHYVLSLCVVITCCHYLLSLCVVITCCHYLLSLLDVIDDDELDNLYSIIL